MDPQFWAERGIAGVFAFVFWKEIRAILRWLRTEVHGKLSAIHAKISQDQALVTPGVAKTLIDKAMSDFVIKTLQPLEQVHRSVLDQRAANTYNTSAKTVIRELIVAKRAEMMTETVRFLNGFALRDDGRPLSDAAEIRLVEWLAADPKRSTGMIDNVVDCVEQGRETFGKGLEFLRIRFIVHRTGAVEEMMRWVDNLPTETAAPGESS